MSISHGLGDRSDRRAGSDVDRSKKFYSEQVGFPVDFDTQSPANPNFRVIQMTPPGSGCSVTMGNGMSPMSPGTLKGSSWWYPT